MSDSKKNITFAFKQQYTFEERRAQYEKVLEKHKGKIPVIVERSPSSAGNIPAIDRNKYLVPGDLSVADFLYLIRKRIKLGTEQALFIYVNGSLPPTSAAFSSVYAEHADEDGFLYVLYTGESSFGGGVNC